MSEPFEDLKYKGNALKEMMAILIRKELAQSYNLNLTEMYLILDYIGMMQDTEDKLRQRVEVSTLSGATLHGVKNVYPMEPRGSPQTNRGEGMTEAFILASIVGVGIMILVGFWAEFFS